jgi:hypothetical protein
MRISRLRATAAARLRHARASLKRAMACSCCAARSSSLRGRQAAPRACPERVGGGAGRRHQGSLEDRERSRVTAAPMSRVRRVDGWCSTGVSDSNRVATPVHPSATAAAARTARVARPDGIVDSGGPTTIDEEDRDALRAAAPDDPGAGRDEGRAAGPDPAPRSAARCGTRRRPWPRRCRTSATHRPHAGGLHRPRRRPGRPPGCTPAGLQAWLAPASSASRSTTTTRSSTSGRRPARRRAGRLRRDRPAHPGCEDDDRCFSYGVSRDPSSSRPAGGLLGI